VSLTVWSRVHVQLPDVIDAIAVCTEFVVKHAKRMSPSATPVGKLQAGDRVAAAVAQAVSVATPLIAIAI